jgi:NTP pyrophosphatase (non-canonical NTP hydrolase)
MAMGDRFVSPCPLPNDVEREILTTLIEEAAEVIQRATKLMRFGRDEIQPGQPLTNAERLACEIGDFAGMVTFAINAGLVQEWVINENIAIKAERFEKYRQHREPEVSDV